MHRARLHWLLPDWPWQLDTEPEQAKITLASPAGEVELCIRWESAAETGVTLARAGELLSGSGAVEASRGWVSHTYAQRSPALSLAIELQGRLPLTFRSEWRLP